MPAPWNWGSNFVDGGKGSSFHGKGSNVCGKGSYAQGIDDGGPLPHAGVVPPLYDNRSYKGSVGKGGSPVLPRSPSPAHGSAAKGANGYYKGGGFHEVHGPWRMTPCECCYAPLRSYYSMCNICGVSREANSDKICTGLLSAERGLRMQAPSPMSAGVNPCGKGSNFGGKAGKSYDNDGGQSANVGVSAKGANGATAVDEEFEDCEECSND